jgi:hypothetical protein
MKQIVPISIFNNGQYATILNSYAIYDDLNSYAKFQYFLLTDSLETLAQGILTMTGEAYVDYQTNLYAWDWIAAQLNLTIVGDVTTTTTTEAPATTTTTLFP